MPAGTVWLCAPGPKCNFNLMRSVDISGCSASAARDMQVLCDKRVLSAEQRQQRQRETGRESNEVVGLPLNIKKIKRSKITAKDM